MEDNALRAKKYRERAAEIRVIADDIRGDNNRRLLLKVAKDYERMASDFEAMDLARPSIRKA